MTRGKGRLQTCEECGGLYLNTSYAKNRRLCGPACRGKVVARKNKGRTIGHRRLTSKGRPVLYLPGHPRAHSKGVVYEHLVIAERALGKQLPASAVVHHVDRNRENNHNSNLVLCQDQAYHLLLHARQRVQDAGGNPSTDAICGQCHQVKNRNEFYPARRRALGVRFNCKSCQSDYHQRSKSRERITQGIAA